MLDKNLNASSSIQRCDYVYLPDDDVATNFQNISEEQGWVDDGINGAGYYYYSFEEECYVNIDDKVSSIDEEILALTREKNTLIQSINAMNNIAETEGD